MRYDAHELLVAPARPSAGLMRLLGGLALTAALFLCLSFAYSSVHRSLLPPDQWMQLAGELITAKTPRAVLINLYSFGLLTIALCGGVYLVHERAPLTLLGPPRLAIAQFRRAVLAVVALYVVVAFLPSGEAMEVIPNLSPSKWLLLLPLGLGGLLVQTATEEIVFRGYIQSQLAARFSSPLVWIGLPSAVFAILHYDPTLDPAVATVVVIWAGLFAAAAADLTARAGTLGPAIGLHMINNVSAILIAAPKGNFDGLALFTFPFSLDDPAAALIWAPVDMLLLFCGWLAVRLSLQR